MRTLFQKLNNQSEQKRLVKEACLLRRDAEETYWAELNKPIMDRDNELMEQCLMLIKETSSIIDSKSKVSVIKSAAVFQKALAVACAVLLLFVVTTGVAAAIGLDFGLKIWSIFIASNNDGIEIKGEIHQSDNTNDINNNSDNSESSIFDTVDDTNGFIEVKSITEATDRLNINPRIFDLTNQGLIVDNIYILKDSNLLEMSVNYSSKNTETDYVSYVVSVFNDKETAYTTSILGDYINTYSVVYNNITVYIADNSTDDSNSECTIAWIENDYVYQVYSNLSADTMLKIIEGIYK